MNKNHLNLASAALDEKNSSPSPYLDKLSFEHRQKILNSLDVSVYAMLSKGISLEQIGETLCSCITGAELDALEQIKQEVRSNLNHSPGIH